MKNIGPASATMKTIKITAVAGIRRNGKTFVSSCLRIKDCSITRVVFRISKVMIVQTMMKT